MKKKLKADGYHGSSYMAHHLLGVLRTSEICEFVVECRNQDVDFNMCIIVNGYFSSKLLSHAACRTPYIYCSNIDRRPNKDSATRTPFNLVKPSSILFTHIRKPPNPSIEQCISNLSSNPNHFLSIH